VAFKVAVAVPEASRRTLLEVSALGDDIREALLDVVETESAELFSEALARVRRSSGGGRAYRRGGRLHRASAPGEPPASDTGELARTVRRKVFRQDLAASVSVAARFGFMLESGTRHIRPRPWLVPVRAARADRFVAAVEGALEGVVRQFEASS
jgi:hypothetical protein